MPQLPAPTITEPEVTIFIILKVDATNAVTAPQCMRMLGNGNSDIILLMGGVGNNFLRFFSRSLNGQSADCIDTVNIVGDGNFYLVVCQYSYLTRTGRLIINGRDTPVQNLLMDKMDFLPATPQAQFIWNSNNAGTAKWLGDSGTWCWYDVALMSDANINKLANKYFLRRFPSLVWTDLP